MPNVSELNGTVVREGGGVPCGSPSVQMPTTGAAFDSLAKPVSSSAVTATDRVRLACAVMRKYPASPYPLSEPTQSPGEGIGAGAFHVSVAAQEGIASALPDIRMSCSKSPPAATVITMGSIVPDGATWDGS